MTHVPAGWKQEKLPNSNEQNDVGPVAGVSELVSAESEQFGIPAAPRGYRPRPLAEVKVLIDKLARLTASESVGTLPPDGEGGCVYVVPALTPGWYPSLSRFLAQLGSYTTPGHVPVQGVTDLLTTVQAVTPAVQAIAPALSVLARRARRTSTPRTPLLTSADVTSLWLGALARELRTATGQSRWAIRIAELGDPSKDEHNFVVFAELMSASVLWRPRWRPWRRHDAAVAQWLLLRADGEVLAGGLQVFSAAEAAR